MNGRFLLASLALLLSNAASPNASADVIFSIGDGGASLLRYSSDTPGSVTRVGSFNGAGTFLDGIDFRPSNGQLYGYLSSSNTYYTVNTTTGALAVASVASPGAPTNTFNLGLGWNPTNGLLSVVTDSTQNITYNPTTGTATAGPALAYAPGDVNTGLVPKVIETAYTNKFAGSNVTQNYVIDYGLGTLATLANNTGILTTVGQIKLNGNAPTFDEFTGFDIFSSPAGSNKAYALLTVGGAAGLYSINLATAGATSLGAIGTGFGQVYGLAVAPVPEPSTIVSLTIGIGAIGLASLRRRRK